MTMIKSDMGAAGPVLGVMLASILIVGILLLLLAHFDLEDEVVGTLQWLEAQGLWAPLLFVVLMAVVVVLLLPGTLLTTGAGFVFGVLEGALCVVIGTTIGAAVAFLIARRLLGERAARYILEHPGLSALDSELVPHGWKVVMLTRLVPFFPAKLSNYFFGLTSVSLRAFTAGNLVGLIPLALHNAYLGALAAEVVGRGERTDVSEAVPWSLYGAGLVAIVAAVAVIGRLAWRALQRQQRG